MKLSTDFVRKHERNDFWRDLASVFWDAYLPDGCEPFEGRLSSYLLGSLVIYSDSYSRHSGIRAPSRLRNIVGEQYYIQLVASGTAAGTAEGSDLAAKPGDIIVSSTRRNLALECSCGGTLSVIIDRAEIEPVTAGAELHGRLLKGNTVRARILASVLSAVFQQLERGGCHDLQDIKDALISMIACCFAPETEYSSGMQFKQQVCEYIRDNLWDYKMSARSICETFKVSRPVLYRAFEEEGGVSHFIKKQRLENALLMLRQAPGHSSLKKIAFDCGFLNSVQFASSFRKEFGESPRQVEKCGPGVFKILPTAFFHFEKFRSLEVHHQNDFCL